MRFSIRDLLWLTAVVALAATVWREGRLLQRRAVQWQAEKAALQRESAAALTAKQAAVNRLAHENARLWHQIVVQMEQQQQREAEAGVGQDVAAQSWQRQQGKRRPSLPSEAEN